MSENENDIPMINVNIDDQALQVEQGTMIIEAADKHGITIPRFCYHKKLSIAANCRMCLVDVEKSRKPLPACATPVAEGMVVHTTSKKALEYQKAVMEFLLINHPLDCPICDQGGECELQDVAMGYGNDYSRYEQRKRVVSDPDIGSLIATDLTRCIHCTRCVRFGTEVAGLREFGMNSRGETSKIGTFLSNSADSELSGNVIDLCPVGALTAKPSRYRGRSWEYQARPAIAPHDCLGSHVEVHTRRNEVMRVVPRECEEINEVWISNRDRFSYQGLSHQDRLQTPMIKRNGQWDKVSFEEAFEYVTKQVKKRQESPEQIHALAGSTATVEEYYLLQKIVRALGSNNLDYRVVQSDFSQADAESVEPGINCSLEEIAQSDAICIIGAHIRANQPLLQTRIRQASLNGAQVLSFNPADFGATWEQDTLHMSRPDVWVEDLKAFYGALEAKKALPKMPKALASFAKVLLKAQAPVVLWGEYIQAHPDFANLLYWIEKIKQLVGAKGGQLSHGPNTRGASIAGFLPHRLPGGLAVDKAGSTWVEMLEGDQSESLFFVMALEPHLDTLFAAKTAAMLSQSEMVVGFMPYIDEAMAQYFDVVFPVSSFTETSGTYVNVSGLRQGFCGAIKPPGMARPLWKVLRVLGNYLDLEGFDYQSAQEVASECFELAKKQSSASAVASYQATDSDKKQKVKCMQIPYDSGLNSDALVRRAAALNQTQAVKKASHIQMSPQLAKVLDIVNGDQVALNQASLEIEMAADCSIEMAEDSVFVSQKMAQTSAIGQAFEDISLKKVHA